LAAVLQKKGTREDIENNMPEFLLRTMKKESECNLKKVQLLVIGKRQYLDFWLVCCFRSLCIFIISVLGRL